MPKTAANKVHAVYHPTTLRLNSDAHRASLEGNDVSVLSGRDPTAAGSIRRMPPGVRVGTSSFPSVSTGWPQETRFVQRRGVHSGHILRTKTTTAVTITAGADTTHTFYVGSTAGFKINDWVAVWVPNSQSTTERALLGYISAIGNAYLTVTHTTFGVTWTMPIGATVARCGCWAYNIATGRFNDPVYAIDTGTFTTDILRGGKVQFIGQADQFKWISDDQKQVVLSYPNVFYVETALANSRLNKVAILPVWDDYSSNDAIVSFSNGYIESLRGAAWTAIHNPVAMGLSSNPWQLSAYDTMVIGMNGRDRPMRLTPEAIRYDPTKTWQGSPTEYLGYPEAPPPGDPAAVWALSAAVPTKGMTAGTHKLAVRFVDKSVFPFAQSPLVASHSLTTDATNATITLNLKGLVTQCGFTWLAEGLWYKRSTHLQVWMSLAGGGEWFLVDESHLSNWVTWNGGTGQPEYRTVSLVVAGSSVCSDAILFLGEQLDRLDRDKGLPPNGRYIAHWQGLTFVAGKTDEAADTPHPRISSGNYLFFSRLDANEPENFPAGNYHAVGSNGDEIRALAPAGSCMLVLNRLNFTRVERFGDQLAFFGGGSGGRGLAWAGAYHSHDNGAAWVSDKSVWLFDEQMKAARDIGRPIRDWVIRLRTIINEASGDRVRIFYDSTNDLIWVGYVLANGTAADTLCYVIAEDAWIRRENMSLDAPFNGLGIESSTSPGRPYRFGQLNCYRILDDETTPRPLIEGAWTADTYSGLFKGTLGSPLSGATGLTGLSGLPTSPANCLQGLIIHFIQTDGTEFTRVITANGATSVTWATALSVTTGASWIIGGVPFRVRFPVIRGDDPFLRKVVRTVQGILDVHTLPTGISANLTVKAFRNWRDTLHTGGTATIAISEDSARIDPDWGAKVEASGRAIEIEIDQLDRHADFSVLYLGVPVSSPGTFAADRSTSEA